MDRKLSIRFYKDREVRAVWDGEHNKWWFSVLDIIGVLNEQDDYSKNRNYWKYLKTKLKKENNELVSATNQLKLQAPDGKLRLTDVLDNEGIMLLARKTFLIIRLLTFWIGLPIAIIPLMDRVARKHTLFLRVN